MRPLNKVETPFIGCLGSSYHKTEIGGYTMNKIKGYRNMFGLTQEKLGELLGLSRITVARKEKNDSFTKAERLAIVTIFNEYGKDYVNSLTESDIF